MLLSLQPQREAGAMSHGYQTTVYRERLRGEERQPRPSAQGSLERPDHACTGDNCSGGGEGQEQESRPLCSPSRM